jgi:hypothetical protein
MEAWIKGSVRTCCELIGEIMESRTIVCPVAEGGDTLYWTSISPDADLAWQWCDLWKNGLAGSGFSSSYPFGMTTSIFGLGLGDDLRGMSMEVW